MLPARWKGSCYSVLVCVDIEAWVGDDNGELSVKKIDSTSTQWELK